MKIVFITREGYRLPGARIRCYNFSRKISSYGIDTKVLSFSDDFGAQDGEKESALTIRDKVRLNYLAFKELIRDKETILYLQRFNYHSFAPYMVHILKRNKIILDLDDWEMREDPKYHLGFYPSSKAHYLTAQIARRSIFCVAASRFLQDLLLQFNKKVYYIPSGVDTSRFNDRVLNRQAQGPVIFSWIGTFHKKEYIENIKFALDCFGLIRQKCGNVFFDIVGDGIYKENLLKILGKDSHVRYKGWIDPDQIPAYLKTVSVGLLPVATDNKFNRAKSPTKLFEYMAMAKPTISSSIGEAVFIIKHGYNGFLAVTKDKFIENMCILTENPQLRASIGAKARQTVEADYSLDVLCRRLFEAFKLYKQ